jgi:outer membrane murein-binding lipoprotein Lpp
MVLVVTLAVVGAGCGGGEEEGGDGRESVPRALSKAESAAEDTIDLILAGKRDQAVRSARDLDALAQDDLEADLEGTASKEELGELQARAAEVARLAPDGEPIAVALAANRAFELVARFFGRYETAVPGSVMVLDHLDFEAKLRAQARELDPLRATVDQLSKTWGEVAKTLPAGDDATRARTRFEAHVGALSTLVAAGTDFDGMAREAEHGLDVVDELEAVYQG